MRKIRQISYMNVLLLLFMAGSVSGCMTANLLSGELLKQIGYFDFTSEEQYALNREEKETMWLYILKSRAGEFGIAALAGMTPFARLVFGVIAFAGGFGCSLIISVFTLYDGWRGLFDFGRMMVPHWPLYFTVWVILAAAAETGLEKMKLRSWLLLFVIAVIGTLAETWF